MLYDYCNTLLIILAIGSGLIVDSEVVKGNCVIFLIDCFRDEDVAPKIEKVQCARCSIYR